MIKTSFLEIQSQNKKNAVDYAIYNSTINSCAFPDHWHDNIELIFVKSGEIEVSLGNKIFLLKPYDVGFFNTNLIHGAVSRSNELEYEMIQIKYDTLKRISEINPAIGKFLSHETNIECYFRDSKFEYFCNKAKKLTKRHSDKSLSELSFVCELFDYLFTNHQTDETADMYSNQKFTKIIAYLNEHHKEKITISEIAYIFSFDVSYFSRRFKEVVGLTPSSYINALRIFSAEKLLLSTDDSIDFIASQCGFESTQYFIRCFKIKYGLSPFKYRKSKQHIIHSKSI